MSQPDYKILGFDLIGGGACPEQYDVFKNDKQVGYIRLRWGCLTVDCPEAWDEEVYQTDYGHGMTGCFNSEEDRVVYLVNCCRAIRKWLRKNGQ